MQDDVICTPPHTTSAMMISDYFSGALYYPLIYQGHFNSRSATLLLYHHDYYYCTIPNKK